MSKRGVSSTQLNDRFDLIVNGLFVCYLLPSLLSIFLTFPNKRSSTSVESVSMERWGQSDPEMHVILSSSSRALVPRSQPLGFAAVRRRWTRLDRPRRSRVVAMVAVL